MMFEKEDLGLALSLGCNHGSKATPPTQNQQQRSAFQLNLMPSMFAASSSSSTTSLTVPNLHFSSAKNVQNPSWLDSFHSSSDRTSFGGGAVAGKGTVDPRSFLLGGIDVNRLPANAVDDEEAGVSSPISTISSVSGKRSEREVIIRCGVSAGGDDLDLGSRGMSDEEDGDTSRKKLRLSKDQSAILEESFKEHSTLNPKQKLALAKRLGLRPRQVEVWFQNRRARTKFKQTEVDCEFLKRCCEQLTEENRRLQKEVLELRQLKLSPQFYMQMAPPTTLTMCPSCERVGPPPSSGAAAASTANGPHHRGLPLSPWGTPAPVPIRPFEALHPRS